MNQTLQAERDLRARIKARLEHRCLERDCQEHGPADAADIMLVSYIYTAERIRHYGTGSPPTTKAAEDAAETWRRVYNAEQDRCIALTVERDSLRKEVEDLKQSLHLVANSRDRWRCAAEESRKEANRNGFERNEALAKLYRFQWKPVSTPPTEADGKVMHFDYGAKGLITPPKVLWCGPDFITEAPWDSPPSSATGWMALSSFPASIPTPLPTETEEEQAYKQWLRTQTATQRRDMHPSDAKRIFTEGFQAALKSAK